jgi:predicted transcriptional regulator
MASSKDNNNSPPASSSDNHEKQRQQSLRFRILDKLYSKSKGYKYAYIPFDSLYEELQANNEDVRKSFEALRAGGLVDSKAIGYASITTDGVNYYERTLLGYPESSTHFPPDVIEAVATQSMKNEIINIKNKRDAFLTEAYKLSKGSPDERLNAFEIMSSSNYDKETIERIYFYLVDEGLIKPFATGGELTITPKGIEQVEKGSNE